VFASRICWSSSLIVVVGLESGHANDSLLLGASLPNRGFFYSLNACSMRALEMEPKAQWKGCRRACIG